MSKLVEDNKRAMQRLAEKLTTMRKHNVEEDRRRGAKQGTSYSKKPPLVRSRLVGRPQHRQLLPTRPPELEHKQYRGPEVDTRPGRGLLDSVQASQDRGDEKSAGVEGVNSKRSALKASSTTTVAATTTISPTPINYAPREDERHDMCRRQGEPPLDDVLDEYESHSDVDMQALITAALQVLLLLVGWLVGLL